MLKPIIVAILLCITGLALGTMGMLLRDSLNALGAVFLGFFPILWAYAFWHLGHSEEDWRWPLSFGRAICEAIIVVFALMGIVLVLHGLGVLIGVDGLSAMGVALADIFGWSSL